MHWFEDAYVWQDTPLIGRYVARPNIVHHHYPRYMTRHNWWQSSWDLCVLSALVVLIAWACGVLNWEVWLFAILAANANEFHKWAHRTKKENGPVITFLQMIGLLQSTQHHAKHHTDPKNSHYCTMTNFLNPMLDGIRLQGRHRMGAGEIGRSATASGHLGSRPRPGAGLAGGISSVKYGNTTILERFYELARPEGTHENSPAFQCRVRTSKMPSPAGTTGRRFVSINRPFGTRQNTRADPALKRRAISGRP